MQTLKLNKDTKIHEKINLNSSKHNLSFHGGLATSSHGRQAGGGSAHQEFSLGQCHYNQKQHDKSHCTTFPNIPQLLNVDLPDLYPLIKDLFQMKLKHVLRKKTKPVFRKLGKTDTSRDYSVHCKRCQNPILTNSIPEGSL